MAKTMQEVLAEHRISSYRVGSHVGLKHMPDIGVYETRCTQCGPIKESESAHQAAALSAAGFGLVADAKREAWDEGYEGAVDAYDGRNVSNPYRKASNDDE